MLLFFVPVLVAVKTVSAGQGIKLAVIAVLALVFCLREPYFHSDYLPVGRGIIRTLRCRTLGDSINEGPGGSGKIRVKIIQVSTYAGALFSADYSAVVHYRGGEKLMAGSEFTVSATAPDKPGGPVFGNPEPSSLCYPSSLWRFRNRLRSGLDLSVKESPQNGLVKALLLGDRNDLEAGLPAMFRRAGIAHILALSGMHLHFVCSLFALLLGKLFSRRTVFILMCPAVLFYLMLAGPLESLIRGVLFWFLLNLDRQTRASLGPRFCLLLTGLVLAAAYPPLASSLSFLFSLTALAGILWLSAPAAFFLRKYLPPAAASAFAAGAAAWTATMPFQILYFQETVPTGILISILVSPFVFLFMTIGTAVLVLPAVLPGAVSIILGFLYRVISGICRIGISFPRFHIGAAVNFWCLLLLCILLAVYAIYTERNLRRFDQLQFSAGTEKPAGRK